MPLTGSTNDEKIYNYLKAAGLNDYGVSGLMGNLYAESGLIPNNLENYYESKLGFKDATYTAAVDNGTYTKFTSDSAGYGLAQWTYSTRKAGLLNYAKSKGTSIGDLETQLGYLIKELTESFPSVLNTLKTATSVKVASDSVLINFERPANMSDSVKQARANYGLKYYNLYAGKTTTTTTTGGSKTMTENELRQKVVNIATKYLGCKESDGSHRKIIDIYNNHKPLANGYRVQYTDAWCSTFASAVAIEAGLTDIIPTECGCERHINLFKKIGSWVENDAYVPKPGDYIFYYWKDNGVGDCTGAADHVGIVTNVSGANMTIIEGNKNDSVSYRTIQVNGKFIRGFGVPKYSSKCSGTSSGSTTSNAVNNTTSSTTNTTTSSSSGLKYNVGDIVNFTGNTHYVSSVATNGSPCKPGTAKVTHVAKGAAHPYSLVKESNGGSTVYGWVNESDIAGKVINTHTVVSGDTLWGISRKYGTTIAKLIADNKTKYPKITTNLILPGWVLNL